jgi:hypothetical protein
MGMPNNYKPRLVFFRWDQPDRPDFIERHLHEQYKCLSHSFDVKVLWGNCDYQRVCDIYEPDVALFESGVYVDSKKREITNVSANPQIPKLGFFHADAMCWSRSSFLSDMTKWGIETFFSMSVSMPEYFPVIADQLYMWPNGIDSDTFHDYGEHKNIPILITGSLAPHYPWRNRVSNRLSQYYPTMKTPHFGWGTASETSRTIHGERYARLINASWFVPSCGTLANDVVRKQFEIPGSKACLITQRTPAIEAAGFIDGQNCVFADEQDVVERVDYLLRNADQLESIIVAGYELVHSRHTMRNRDQIYQWFALSKELKAHQYISQPSPFDQLKIADDRSGSRPSPFSVRGVDRALLREGKREVLAGRFELAQRYYSRALNYLSHLPEAKLGLAICALYSGKPSVATRWLDELVTTSLVTFCADEPDPVEWAYLVVAQLCKGDFASASRLAKRFPNLHCPQLGYTRLLVGTISGEGEICPKGTRANDRPSVHCPLSNTYEEWTDSVCTMLRACHQLQIADLVSKVRTSHLSAQFASDSVIDKESRTKATKVKHSDRFALSQGCQEDPAAKYIASVKHLIKPVRDLLLNLLNRLECTFGYFLPYRLSAMRADELYSSIESLARDPANRTILLLGAPREEGSTKACLLGASANPIGPTVFYLDKDPTIVSMAPDLTLGPAIIKHVSQSVESIMQTHRSGGLGMVIVGGNNLDDKLYEQIRGAGVIVIEEILSSSNSNIYRSFLEDNDYILLSHNQGRRAGGYATFRKKCPIASTGISRGAQTQVMLDD